MLVKIAACIGAPAMGGPTRTAPFAASVTLTNPSSLAALPVVWYSVVTSIEELPMCCSSETSRYCNKTWYLITSPTSESVRLPFAATTGSSTELEGTRSVRDLRLSTSLITPVALSNLEKVLKRG
jgi:hypothetical protein